MILCDSVPLCYLYTMWFQKLCRQSGKLIHDVLKPLPVRREDAAEPRRETSAEPKVIARRTTTTVTTVEEVELHPPTSSKPPD